MELSAYLDAARARAGIPSDRQLAISLGIVANSLRQYRLGLATPQPETMVKLAALAGVPAEVALLDHMAWRADGPVSRDVVSRIREIIAAAAVVILMLFQAIPANAAPVFGDIIERSRYIMEIKRPGDKPVDVGKAGPRQARECSNRS